MHIIVPFPSYLLLLLLLLLQHKTSDRVCCEKFLYIVSLNSLFTGNNVFVCLYCIVCHWLFTMSLKYDRSNVSVKFTWIDKIPISLLCVHHVWSSFAMSHVTGWPIQCDLFGEDGVGHIYHSRVTWCQRIPHGWFIQH